MIFIKSLTFLITIIVLLNDVKCQDDNNDDDNNNTTNVNTMTVIIVVTVPTINVTPVANTTTTAANIDSVSNGSITGTSTKTAPFYIPYYIPKNKLGKLFTALCHPTCLKQKRTITQKCMKNIQLLDIYNKCELTTGPAYSCVHCCMKSANETSIPVNGGHFGYQISCVRRTMNRDEHVCVDKYVKTVRREIRKNYGYQTARSV